jgi:hypothetical protein
MLNGRSYYALGPSRPSSKTGEGAYGSSGWRRPVHPATTGGEGYGERVQGHEGAAGIPIEAKTWRRLTGNQASHGGEAQAGRNGGRGTGQKSMQQAGWSGSCTGSPWCLRRTERGRLCWRWAVGLEALSR